jgi:hypothetical protein
MHLNILGNQSITVSSMVLLFGGPVCCCGPAGSPDSRLGRHASRHYSACSCCSLLWSSFLSDDEWVNSSIPNSETTWAVKVTGPPNVPFPPRSVGRKHTFCAWERVGYGWVKISCDHVWTVVGHVLTCERSAVAGHWIICLRSENGTAKSRYVGFFSLREKSFGGMLWSKDYEWYLQVVRTLLSYLLSSKLPPCLICSKHPCLTRL